MKLSKDIYRCTFTAIDRVTLCITEKEYNKVCKSCGSDCILDTDGVTTKFANTGTRDNVVIGIKEYLLKDELGLVGILAHEITHAVDIIMLEQGYTDMEMRAYMVHDMIVKSYMFINKYKGKKC